MDSHQSINSVRIQTAQDRSNALIEQVRRLKTRVYSSPASHILLNFVHDCALNIGTLLQREQALSEGELLKPEEIDPSSSLRSWLSNRVRDK